jgi:hypothetical protein
MPHVQLTDAEWSQVMAILGEAPWKIVHPLLLKIGGQLHAQAQVAAAPLPPKPLRMDGIGTEEARDE